MIESNKVHCKVCSLLKTRIESGKYPNSKNKRYVDENGKLWVGKKCAQCVVELSRERMRSFRSNQKIREAEESLEKEGSNVT